MKTNWKVIAIFAAIFLAGAVAGTFWGVRVVRYFSPRPPPAEQFWSQKMRELTEQLRLTPEQGAKIQPIMQQAAEDIRKNRREAAKAAGAIFENMYESIAKELTDAQLPLLREMQAKEKARHQWMNGRPKPHGNGPPRHGPPPPQPPGPEPDANHGPAPTQS